MASVRAGRFIDGVYDPQSQPRDTTSLAWTGSTEKEHGRSGSEVEVDARMESRILATGLVWQRQILHSM